MIRFAITRDEDGGSEVPVPSSVRGSFDASSSDIELSGTVRLKNKVGTEPHVIGAINVATAEPPGCRNRSNLCTSFDVFPPWENRGLITRRRGPHCMINSVFDLIGSGYSELRLKLKLRTACLCSCRSSEKRLSGCDGLYVDLRETETLRR